MLNELKYIKGSLMETIGDLIPKRGVTLLHGRSGCGKTLSILKYLEKYDVVPIFIDFDTNDAYDDMNITHIDGWKLADKYNNDSIKLTEFANEVSDNVIIIDTYTMADKALNGSVNSLIDALRDNLCTIIVIAHTTYYSGKPSEPNVDTLFANHTDCRLHLINEVKKTNTYIALEIEKLRGVESKRIENWMRK